MTKIRLTDDEAVQRYQLEGDKTYHILPPRKPGKGWHYIIMFTQSETGNAKLSFSRRFLWPPFQIPIYEDEEPRYNEFDCEIPTRYEYEVGVPVATNSPGATDVLNFIVAKNKMMATYTHDYE